MSEASPSSKSELRRGMRAALNAIPTPPPDVATPVADWLISRPDLRRIALFAALPGEPDLLPLLAALPDRTWYLPRVAGDDALTFHEVRCVDELTRTAFGIREPAANAPAIPIGDIDAFLCPGLAFDPWGGRLGRGRGYYDRMLAAARMNALKAGVCFDRQRVTTTFPEHHDVAMDLVICESGITTPAAERAGIPGCG